MLDFARTKLDIVAPAGDLIYRNAYDILMTEVTDGFVVGKAVIEGVRCDHLAFRAPHVDLQIWIQEGSEPLPRKLVITTRDLANAPQFAVDGDQVEPEADVRRRRRSASRRRPARRRSISSAREAQGPHEEAAMTDLKTLEGDRGWLPPPVPVADMSPEAPWA